jgi:hypothetical protein
MNQLCSMIIEFCGKTKKWTLNHPLMPFADTCKKHKKCCKSYKDGDRCKKCPGRKH